VAGHFRRAVVKLPTNIIQDEGGPRSSNFQESAEIFFRTVQFAIRIRL